MTYCIEFTLPATAHMWKKVEFTILLTLTYAGLSHLLTQTNTYLSDKHLLTQTIPYLLRQTLTYSNYTLLTILLITKLFSIKNLYTYIVNIYSQNFFLTLTYTVIY
jgi:hypothetical protein